MLLNLPHYTEQLLTAKKYLAANISSTEVEKLCLAEHVVWNSCLGDVCLDVSDYSKLSLHSHCLA